MVQIGDITIQDEAAKLPVTKIGVFSRDMTAATGSVGYTGVGFRPSYVQFFLVEPNDCWSWGCSDGSGNFDTFIQNTLSGGSWDNTFCLRAEQTGGNIQTGAVTSLDADGFTISWAKVSSPTGTAQIVYMAFK
jgi:hypothetical protein